MIEQFLAPLTEPLGAVWLLMFEGTLFLLWRRRWQCSLLIAIPTLALFIIGSTSLAETLVAREESHYAGLPSVQGAVDGQIADAVVALGGGIRVSRFEPVGFAMENGGARVFTAVELVRFGKAKMLVLGGSNELPDRHGIPSMTLIQNWLVSWRLVSGGVTNLGICANTHDEAVACEKMEDNQHWKKVLLVTSALHMRRAVAAFQKQGVNVVPVAADFQAFGAPQDAPFSIFPREYRFMLLSLYLHERIGWWVYRWRGWV